jgi:mono/diheme cytochrome c family protein
MNETMFYVLGIGLVAAALIVAFAGLRFESFPGSRGVQLAVTGLFAALMIGTGVFAWQLAEDEQDHRAHELAAAEEENLAEGQTGEAAEQGAETATTTDAVAADGAQVFADNGCGGCHTLEAAGSSGTTGPVLDSELKGKTPEFIHTSIVDPNDEIAQGYPPDVMPQSYDQLPPEQLDALVQYLFESTNPKS